MTRIKLKAMTIAVLATILSARAIAQPYAITWSTVDGGGIMFSNGGPYQLGATAGQPDAGPSSGPMTGGSYSLVGGFWLPASTCTCLGDMNADGLKDGRDLQQFVDCVTLGGDCACGNVDGLAGVTLNDVAVFVGDLLAGSACP
jgi:hypothetical protein